MAEQHGELRGRQTEENFLKTILMLQRRHGVVTPGDLEAELSYKTSAVYNFVNKLDKEGYIIANRGTRGKKPSIELTDKGRVVAERIFQRHQQIQDWLMLLGTPEEDAAREACLFEHGLSEITMDIISRHVELAKASFGKSAPYPEKMKRMAQAMAQVQTNKTGMTETDKMVGIITAHGGYETLIQQSQVLEMLGGEACLREQCLQLADLGGFKGIYARDAELAHLGGLDTFRQLLSALDDFGGVEQLYALQGVIDQLGGLKRLKNTIELYEQYGEPKKIKEKIATLQALDDLGGFKEVNRKLNALEAWGGLDGIGKTHKKLDKIQKILLDN